MKLGARRLAVWVASAACWSCAGSDPHAGAAGSETGDDPPATTLQELRIGVVPRTGETWLPVFAVDDDAAELRLTATTPLSLALGEAYPSTFTVQLDEIYLGTCGMLAGSFAIETLTAAPGVQMTRRDDASFVVEIADEAIGDARVQGALHFDDPTGCDELLGAASVPFELQVPTRVARPAGVSVGPPAGCADASTLRIESGARFPRGYSELVPYPVDAAGEELYPSNATQMRSVEVVVRAASSTTIGLDVEADGLASLFVSGPPGDVTIAWEDQELLTFEMVATETIDAMELGFALLGFGGGGLALESGGSYGEQGFARTSSSIGVTVEGLLVDGDPVCTLPRPDAFELISHTPEICPAFAELGHGDYPYDGAPVPVSADMLRSGECRLDVLAPGFDGGNGLDAELTVAIDNTESLISIGERR
jgi:hypothetical protein